VEADAAEAAEAFEAAALADDEFGAFNLGFLAMRGIGRAANYTQAKRLFEQAAEKELPAAFNGLGVLAFNGWGEPANHSLAREWFERGAALGDPDASYNLANALLYGHGAAPDAAAALRSFEAASDAGHWRAPLQLATMHADGLGTPRNCSASARLLSLFLEERLGWAEAAEDAAEAAAGGDVQGALAQLAPLALQGCEAAQSDAAFLLSRRRAAHGQPRAQALHRAQALLSRAALQGSPEALVDLGDVRRAQGDVAGAAQSFEQAAAAGSVEGMTNLAVLLMRGAEGVEANKTRARVLLQEAQAAAQSNAAAFAPTLALVALRIAGALDGWTQWQQQVLFSTIAGLAAAAAVYRDLQQRRRRPAN
jgi:SEL1 protein